MNFGKNLQHMRGLKKDMTQEDLAEKLNVSRQTVSKWELDQALPEINKAIELCKLFNCSLDELFREEICARGDTTSNLRVETVPAFRYVKHIVISTTPETDAIDNMTALAHKYQAYTPRIIGWDFACLSPEQIMVHHLRGYAAAWILPDGVNPEGLEIRTQRDAKYAAIHIESPFDNPFATIPNAYRTLMEYMRMNGLEHHDEGVLPCFETIGEAMDIYIACR